MFYPWAMPSLTYKYRLGFIAKIAPAARQTKKNSLVPASITIAQAILESDWGRSQLCKKPYNNFFGIKHSERDGSETYRIFNTKEFIGGKPKAIRAKFETFKDALACFTAHGRLLKEQPIYADAMKHVDDPAEFARNLQGKYATDPQYADKLNALITEFHLMDFDPPTEPPAKAEVAA